MASALLDGLLGSKRCSPAEAMALADFTAVSGAILEGRAASPPVEGMPLHLDLIDKLFRAVIPVTLPAEALPAKAWGEIAASPVETSVVSSHLVRRPSLAALFQGANLSAAELDIVLVSLDNLGCDSSAVLRDVLAKELITVELLKVNNCFRKESLFALRILMSSVLDFDRLNLSSMVPILVQQEWPSRSWLC